MFLTAITLVATVLTSYSDSTYAFVGVSIIPMDGERVLVDQTVIVSDGRIVAIGRTGQVDIPSTAVRIDGAGKYLMPGLAEMHAHIPANSVETAEEVLFLYAAGVCQ